MSRAEAHTALHPILLTSPLYRAETPEEQQRLRDAFIDNADNLLAYHEAKQARAA